MGVTSDPRAHPALTELPRGMPPPQQRENGSGIDPREEQQAADRPSSFLVAVLRALSAWCT